MALRLRRGTDAERLLITPLQGEPIFTTDTKRLYVGDGSTVGGVLVTGDQSNTQVSADTTPQLGGDLDLNGNNITGAGNIAIDGTITATGSINLGDGDEDAISVGGLINTNLRPAIDGAYDVGTSLRRWNNVWAEGANISGQLTADSISVEKIISQDSTVLYEASSNTVTADFLGPLTGNADGDHTGSFTGRITGSEVFRNVINKLDSDDVNITGGKLSNVQIGDEFISGVEIVAERVESNGGLFGTLFGSVHGDVFADDSSLLVDATNSQIFGNVTNNGSVSTVDVNAARISIEQETGDAALDIRTVAGSSLDSNSRIKWEAVHAAIGDIGNPVNPVAGDNQGGFSVSSYDPLSDTFVASSLYLLKVDNQETPSNDYVPGKHYWIANGGLGSSPDLNQMTWDSNGRLAVNQEDANADCNLDVNGIARLAPQAAAPGTLVEGMIAVADGTTWDPAGKSGAVSYPVYYDGAAWQAFY